jgi:ribA/ribD-fused uncharacterized protein
MTTAPVISFRKVSEPYGWLGNMSAYTVRYEGKSYRTAEALFQALRFNDEEIRKEIWLQSSPMIAKHNAKKHASKLVTQPKSNNDIDNMRLVVELKCEQHPDLRRFLLATGDAHLVEDTTARTDRFWGAALIDGALVGENVLGTIWMNLREKLRNENH